MRIFYVQIQNDYLLFKPLFVRNPNRLVKIRRSFTTLLYNKQINTYSLPNYFLCYRRFNATFLFYKTLYGLIVFNIYIKNVCVNTYV